MQGLDVLAPTEEVDDISNATPDRQHFELRALRSFAGEQENRIATSGCVTKLCECFEHDVVALDRLEPTNATNYCNVRRETELLPNLASVVPWFELVGVDAVGDYGNSPR